MFQTNIYNAGTVKINKKIHQRLQLTTLWLYSVVFVLGFIKYTDQLPTDHRPTNPPTTDPLTHRPNNHLPNENFMFKRLENMRTFILQNVNTAGKIENGLLSI